MRIVLLAAFSFLFVLTSCTSELTSDEYLQRGSNYMAEMEWKSAIIEFKNSVRTDSKNPEARLLLGSAYLKTYSSDAAIKELKQAIDLGVDVNKVVVLLGKAFAQLNNNDDIITQIIVREGLSDLQKVHVLSLRSSAYINKNQPEKALAELKLAQRIDENNQMVRLSWASYEAKYGTSDQQMSWLKPLLKNDVADAWSQKGRAERNALMIEKSETSYSKAIGIRGVIHQDYLSRALVRITLKKYDKAKEDLSALRKAGFSSAMVLHSEGVIAFYQNKLDLAQTKFDTVLSRTKQFPPSLFVLGLVHYQKANFESAVSSLESYLKVVPKNIQARIVLSQSLVRLNRSDEAAVELERLYKQDPMDIRVSSLLGSIYVRNGQLAEGIALFKKSAQNNPMVATTQFQLGSALIQKKSTRRSGQEALLKALDLDPTLKQANLSLYLSYMQSEKLIKAAKTAQNMIDAAPNESLAYNLLGHAFLIQGDKEKALAFFKTTLEKFPSDPVTAGNIANIYLQDNDLQSAKKIYSSVLTKYPNELKALIGLALIESKLGNDDEKIRYLIKAVEQNPKVLSPKVILAREYLKVDKYNESFNTLREIGSDDKTRLDVQFINVISKIGLKEHDYALVLLKKLIAQEPKSSQAYFLLGKNYGHLKKRDKMINAFQKVLDIKPDHFSANLILTKIALLEGRKDEFISRLETMTSIYPDNADVKFLNAKLKSDGKNFKSAVSTLEELLKNVAHPEIVVDLARNKWSLGDRDGAIAGLEIWMDKHPDDKNVLILLAQFYIVKNRYADANKVYEALNKLIPDNAVVLNNMAWLYKDSNPKQGIKLAKKALVIQPNNPYIKDTLAMLLLADEQFKEALLYSKEAAVALQSSAEVQMNYATILIANGQKALARTLLIRLDIGAKTINLRKEIRKIMDTL